MRSKNNSVSIFSNSTIAILAGGPSLERDISFKSADNVYASLKRLGLDAFVIDISDKQFGNAKYDIAFNCVHGKWGEDGILQGYLEAKGIPYTGSGVLATSIGFNKPMFKSVISTLGIPTATIIDPTVNMNLPFVAKPKCNGSSIGIYIIKSENDWKQQIQANPEILSDDYFFESYISGREITIGVIEKNDQPEILPIIEIKSSNEFYDYEGKYTQGKTELSIPNDLSATIKQHCEDIAINIFKYFKCKGCIRIDIILNESGPFVLEMNTCPGLTELSDIPMQAKAADISFDDLMIMYLHSAKI